MLFFLSSLSLSLTDRHTHTQTPHKHMRRAGESSRHVHCQLMQTPAPHSSLNYIYTASSVFSLLALALCIYTTYGCRKLEMYACSLSPTPRPRVCHSFFFFFFMITPTNTRSICICILTGTCKGLTHRHMHSLPIRIYRWVCG